MTPQIHRLQRAAGGDAGRREADRARLLERVAVGLAHEGKNPLHNMVLHVQLMAEKLGSDRAPVEKHLSALRDGIGRVDALLRAFGEFASPEHLPPDLGAAVSRAMQLFAYDARRAGVQFARKGPLALLVAADPLLLSDAVAHAAVAAIELSREGGTVAFEIHNQLLEVRAQGGLGRRDQAEPFLDALRRLSLEGGCELSIEIPPAGGAFLSLSFAPPR
jgi:signal transduction histidine kinase